MKRQWQHPEAEAESQVFSRNYWRNLDELEDNPEFRSWLEREFPQGASEWERSNSSEDSRRTFLKYVGASLSLAGLGMAGCRRPDQYLVPYNEHVEEVIPGKPLFYATAFPIPGGCVPLVVTTHEGRPTFLTGNKLHPTAGRAVNAFVQASILDLYDPDRSKGFMHQGKPATEAEFVKDVLGKVQAAKGAKTGLLLGASTSPTRARLLDEIGKRMPGLKVFQYEPLVSESVQSAEKILFGEGVSVVPQLHRADVLLSLDCDFLGLDPVGEAPANQWAKRRDPGQTMSRLYVVEPSFTVTGASADHRLRLPASQVGAFAVLLAEKLGIPDVSALASQLQVRSEIIGAEWIQGVADDLLSKVGKAAVLAGPRQPEAVQVLVALINNKLGALGGGAAPLPLVQHGRRMLPGLADLVGAILGGGIENLFVLTPADPLFDAPGDLDLAKAFDKLALLVHCGMSVNLTTAKAHWHVPGAHVLEAWGDAYSAEGVLSIIQPMILPLYGGWSELDLLVNLLGDGAGEAGKKLTAYDAVRQTFAGIAKGDVERAWRLALRDGFLDGVRFPRASKVDVEGSKAVLAKMQIAGFPHAGAIEVDLVPSSHVFDGRYANNAWLLESPDPVTKLTWDNAAIMSLQTAERLGISRDGQVVRLTAGQGRTIEAPAFRIPGHADFTITLPVGFGRTGVGRVGSGAGVDVYPLRSIQKPYIVTEVKVEATGRKYPLAPTAIHWSMEGRALVREGTIEMHKENPAFAQDDGMDAHIPPNISLYEGPDYLHPKEQPKGPLQGRFQPDPRHQWAMAIDLNSCLGCNACQIACQAENNIPVVGKDQVIRGREMQWIRMDRYFSSPVEKKGMAAERKLVPESRGRPAYDDDRVEMISQPVGCVHCESAPCETVCPVNATVHSDDGLNAMSYNRCIGTRYCANNCPYKARRFNYFDYNKRRTEDLYLGPLAPAAGMATTSAKLQKNPNVTVRMRGVIEKCTYCVQRIQEAKIEAKAKARGTSEYQVPANRVVTACQDACPTEAISFGNLLNPKETVNLVKADPRNYDLLKYVGTRPRTSYLAKVRNPNPKMPGAGDVGQATASMH